MNKRLTNEQIAELRARYEPSARVLKTCPECGDALQIGSIGSGQITYGCYKRDEAHEAHGYGFSITYPMSVLGDSDVLAVIDELQALKLAAQEARDRILDYAPPACPSGEVDPEAGKLLCESAADMRDKAWRIVNEAFSKGAQS